MDDMTAFEHLIRNAASRAVGPPRPVDAMAVVRSAKAAPEGRWSLLHRRFPGRTSNRPEGGFSMFSALRFIVAGVIVALFGGFLLAGVLTTPQEGEVPPGAATESPSPMMSEELLTGMVTEEVEPGVRRVVNDGVRDLVTLALGWSDSGLSIDPDGGIWIIKQRMAYQLGEPNEMEWVRPNEMEWVGDRSLSEMTADGTPWGTTTEADFGGPIDSTISSFDGESSTDHITLGVVRTSPGSPPRPMAPRGRWSAASAPRTSPVRRANRPCWCASTRRERPRVPGGREPTRGDCLGTSPW